MKSFLRAKVSTGFGLALTILVVIGVASYRSITGLVTNNQQLARTYEALEALESVLSLLKDAETAQRGYVITGEERYLKPYYQAIQAIEPEMNRLEALIQNNPNQQRRLKRLEPLAVRRLVVVKETIDLRANQGFAAALQRVQTNQGKQLMDEIRDLVREMKIYENQRLEERAVAVADSVQYTILIIAAGSLLAIVFVALAIWIISNDITQRQQAELALQKAHDELEIRVQARTAELAQTNTELQTEIHEREQIEAAIKQLNETLEQRVLERTTQLEIANKELDAFAYSVSHDLRAPLRHIDGFAVALSQRLQQNGVTIDAKASHYLDVICDSTRKMQQLIEGLLQLSRLGRRQLVTQPVNVRQLVERAVALVTNQLGEQESAVEVTIGNLPTVMGDATLLQQVFSNLIDNAVKFSRHQCPARVEIGMLADGTIFVKDNGVGFIPGQADQLFGAFQRFHSAKDFEGSGIGLAIVQRIVHRHGGTIWAESQPDQGATFYIRLKTLDKE